MSFCALMRLISLLWLVSAVNLQLIKIIIFQNQSTTWICLDGPLNPGWSDNFNAVLSEEKVGAAWYDVRKVILIFSVDQKKIRLGEKNKYTYSLLTWNKIIYGWGMESWTWGFAKCLIQFLLNLHIVLFLIKKTVIIILQLSKSLFSLLSFYLLLFYPACDLW